MSHDLLDIDFDINTALEQQIIHEKEYIAKEQEKVRLGKKQTPAQRRDSLFVEIAAALQDADFPLVKEILDNNPKLSFQVGPASPVFDALLNNFDTATAQQLVQRELEFDISLAFKHTFKRHNQDLFEFSLSMVSDDPKAHWSKSSRLVMDFYFECLRGLWINTTEKTRLRLRGYREACEEKIPDLRKNAQTSHRMSMIFENYGPGLPQPEMDYIHSLENLDWKALFRQFMSQKNYHDLSASQLSSIMSFYRDFPFVQDGFKTYWQEQQQQHQEFISFVDQYFEEGADTKDTSFFSHLKSYYKGSTYGSSPLTAPEPNKRMKWSAKEMALIKGASPIHYYSSHILPNAPFKEFPKFEFPSLVRNMVGRAQKASLVLLQDPKGAAQYAEILQTCDHERYNWCKSASVEMINAVVKACPELKQWKDKQGNHLGHYLVHVRTEKSKSFVQVLARLHHEWFLDDNNHGVSVQNIFDHNGATKDAQALIEKEMMKRSMRQAGITQTKPMTKAKKRM